MTSTYYTIGSDCYESYPCQHYVTETTTNISTMYYSPDILDMIIEKNIKVTYNQLLHFSYCFDKSEYSEKLNLLLTKLKNEHDINNVRLNSGL